jgi:hypothetical protein
MNCRELAALLTAKRFAELTSEQRKAVAEHVSACFTCKGRWGLNSDSQVLHDAIKAMRQRKPGDGPSPSPPGR